MERDKAHKPVNIGLFGVWSVAGIVSAIYIARKEYNTYAHVKFQIDDREITGTSDYSAYDELVQLAWLIVAFSFAHALHYAAELVPAIDNFFENVVPLYKIVDILTGPVVVVVTASAVGVDSIAELELYAILEFMLRSAAHSADGSSKSLDDNTVFGMLLSGTMIAHAAIWAPLWVTFDKNPEDFSNTTIALFWTSFFFATIENILLPLSRKFVDKSPSSDESESMYQMVRKGIRLFGGFPFVILAFYGGFHY